MAIDLAGKTALITGASRGIGRAIAIGYAQSGADLVLTARTVEALEETRSAVEAHGRRATVLPADITDRDAVQQLVAAAIEALGRVDVVVNNAGGTSFMAAFTDLRFEGWEKVFRLNTSSVVHVLQAVGPHLLDNPGSSVINVASIAALTGTPAISPYGASKAALHSLTKSLAMEWGHRGVRVNSLCPGWTATELNLRLWENADVSAAMMRAVPMGRWAKAEEMVGAAVFLGSDASSYLTGQAIVVDGGLTAGAAGG